jgi:hypothetical protein
MAGTLSNQALNRALLARQGLLERRTAALPETIEAIGAMQAQHWPALPVGLWSRLAAFTPDDLYQALDAGQVRTGILLRGTLHAVSAREYPAYATVSRVTGVTDWRRTKAPLPAAAASFRTDLLDFAEKPRNGEEIATFARDWFTRHPDALDPAEFAAQQERGWRPVCRSGDFVRVPLDGRWNGKTPAGYLAAPRPPRPIAADDATEALVLAHLRAFGPADAADVAYWLGRRTPPVRAALDRLADRLVRHTDETGRDLFDLPDAPLPDPATPAPPRFLPSFDSVLLAYAPGARERILPADRKDAVYLPGNLRILPTFLVDGLVAGTWSSAVRRRVATLTLRPLVELSRPSRAALQAEAERLTGFLYPTATGQEVVFE